MMTRIRYSSTSQQALGISTRKRRYRRKSPYQPIQGPQAVVKLEDSPPHILSINSAETPVPTPAVKVETPVPTPTPAVPTPTPAVHVPIPKIDVDVHIAISPVQHQHRINIKIKIN